MEKSILSLFIGISVVGDLLDMPLILLTSQIIWIYKRLKKSHTILRDHKLTYLKAGKEKRRDKIYSWEEIYWSTKCKKEHIETALLF